VTGEDVCVEDVALSGRLLVATPLLADPPFFRTVVAILEHGPAAGAVGVVLNRPMTLAVDEVLPVVPDLLAPPAVLFDGGPVSPTTAIAVGLPSPGAPAGAGWRPSAPPYVTVDLDADADVLVRAVRRLRVFAGYAGWAAGQLEGEIAEGAWYVVESLPDDVFAPAPETLWRHVLRRQGWPLAAVATCPADPTLN
jgi:putative transcriptional regulator